MICQTCATENEAGQKFCDNCGSALGSTCPSCGASNRAAARFCKECAAPLAADAGRAGTTGGLPAAPAGAGAPGTRVGAPGTGVQAHIAERRLVTILFADLVGFTPYAEGRDAEEVR